MALVRRLSVSVGVAVSRVSALTIASVAAAGGFGSGAGRYDFNDLSAQASSFDQVKLSGTNLFVDRQLFYVHLRGGGPLQGPQLATYIHVDHSVPNADPTQPPVVDYSLDAIIPNADFVVSNNLETATVDTTVDAGSCAEVVPAAGGLPNQFSGGCSIGFSGSVHIAVTWTGTGVIGTSTSNGVQHCGSFTATTQNHTSSVFSANVTATIDQVGGFSGGAPAVFGSVSSNHNVFIVAGTGVISPACGGKGGA